MADDVNDDLPVTQKGLAAADEVLQSEANLGAEEREACRNYLARIHARMGDARFRLRYGLRQPENHGERLLVDFYNKKISFDEFHVRHKAYVERPADVDMLKTLVFELERRLTRYGRFMQEVWAMVNRHHPATIDRCDQYVRAMRRKLNMYTTEINTACQFLSYARARQHQPPIAVKAYTSPTAFELIFLVTKNARLFWKSCKSIARRSEYDPRYTHTATPEQLFWDAHVENLPTAREMFTLLHTDHAIGLVELDERRRQNVGLRTAERIDVNLQAQSVTVNVAGEGRAVDSSPEGETTVLLTVSAWSDLGLGVDEARKVWAVTPVPRLGSDFLKSKAFEVPLRGKRWIILLEMLARSTTGNQADAYSLAAAMDFAPPGTAVPRESRAQSDALRRGHTADLSLQPPPWRGELSSALSDLGRKLRKYVAGPTGKGDSALWIDDKFVMSGFVVRHLFRDAGGHLKFGQPMA